VPVIRVSNAELSEAFLLLSLDLQEIAPPAAIGKRLANRRRLLASLDQGLTLPLAQKNKSVKGNKSRLETA
jgi:hypothetical protein